MIKKLKNTLLVIAFIPLLSMTSLELQTVPVQVASHNQTTSAQETKASASKTKLNQVEQARQEKVLKLKTYFEARSMPLAKESEQFVKVAEKYGLPYDFLPAIAVRESSGGKRDMNNNPFGWGGALIEFDSYNEAIEVVGKNLGGANPRTAAYYGHKSIEKKLYYYNGTVVHTYEEEVMDIMKNIDKTKVDLDADLETELALNK